MSAIQPSSPIEICSEDACSQEWSSMALSTSQITFQTCPAETVLSLFSCRPSRQQCRPYSRYIPILLTVLEFYIHECTKLKRVPALHGPMVRPSCARVMHKSASLASSAHTASCIPREQDMPTQYTWRCCCASEAKDKDWRERSQRPGFALQTFCGRNNLAAATLSSMVKWLLFRCRPSQSMTKE